MDGQEAVALDPPPEGAHRATRPHRFRVPAEATADGALELALAIDTREPRGAWLDGAPFLTTAPDGGPEATRTSGWNAAAAWFALAASVVVALLYGTLFVSMRAHRQPAHGWFALAATCGMAYPAWVLGLAEPVLGPLELPIVCVILAGGSVAAMFFSRAYAGAPPPLRAWWVVLAAAVGCGDSGAGTNTGFGVSSSTGTSDATQGVPTTSDGGSTGALRIAARYRSAAWRGLAAGSPWVRTHARSSAAGPSSTSKWTRTAY